MPMRFGQIGKSPMKKIFALTIGLALAGTSAFAESGGSAPGAGVKPTSVAAKDAKKEKKGAKPAEEKKEGESK